MPCVKPAPEVTDEDWASFRSNMYDGDFVFNVSREWVEACRTPMLVLLGNDLYHPEPTSRELAALAPNATLVERWKEPDAVDETRRTVVEFLQKHTPPAWSQVSDLALRGKSLPTRVR